MVGLGDLGVFFQHNDSMVLGTGPRVNPLEQINIFLLMF